MTAKEIWYVWGGKGGNPDPKRVLSLLQHGANGEIDDSEGFGFTGVNWDSIAAYTLGETRERATCGVCGGIGLQFPHFGGEFEKCSKCQGRGYIWKMGVGNE